MNVVHAASLLRALKKRDGLTDNDPRYEVIFDPKQRSFIKPGE